MTDRFHTLTVVLEKDIRDDDAQRLIDAIKHMRHVLTVTGKVADLDSHMAYERARADLGEKIWEVLYPKYADRK
jgi:hypothetical protein